MAKNKLFGLFFILLVFTLLVSTVAFAKSDAEKEAEKTTKKAEKEAAKELKRSEKSSSKNVTLEKEDTSYGKVVFDNDIETNTSNYKDAIYIGFDDDLNPEIYVNSQEFPEHSTDARIYFYDTGFTNKITVFHDGAECIKCEPVLYGDDDWYLDVTKFSSWMLVETNFTNGTQTATEITADGYLTKQRDAVLAIGFGNSTNSSGNGGLDVSAYQHDFDIIGNAYYNATAGINDTGAYVFDGDDDALMFPSDNLFGNDMDNGYTIIGNMFTYNANGGGQDAESLFGYNGPSTNRNQHTYLNAFNTFINRLTNTTHTDTPNLNQQMFSQENSFVAVSYEASNLSMLFWEEKKWDGGAGFIDDYGYTTATVPLDAGLKAMCWGAFGSPNCNQDEINGTLSHSQIFLRVMDIDEIKRIAYSLVPKVYYEYSNYTSQVFNATDFDPETQVNVWDAYLVTRNNTQDTSQLSGYYRVGDCSTIETLPFNFVTNVGDMFDFPDTQGQCFQYRLEFGGEWNYTDIVMDAQALSYKYVKPATEDLQISPGSPFANDDIFANSTLLINDTDSGGIHFDWYVNDVLVFTDLQGGGLNGTSFQSSLDSSYTSVGDVVYFTSTGNNTLAIGDPQFSPNLTIQNSNFTFTSTPVNATVEVTKPRYRAFEVSVSDIDNDVNVSWYIGSTLQGTGTRFVFYPNPYDDYQLLDLDVNLTDGTHNQSSTWNLEILPPNVQAVAGIAVVMFIMAVVGMFIFLPFVVGRFTRSPIVEMIIQRGCWLIAIFLTMFNASIVANLAEAAGLGIGNELFRYMWIFGWMGFIFAVIFVIKTLFDIMTMWKQIVMQKRMGGDDDE